MSVENTNKTPPINITNDLVNLKELYGKTKEPVWELYPDYIKDPTKLLKYKEYLRTLVELRDLIREHSKKVDQVRNQNTNIAREYVTLFTMSMKQLNSVIEKAEAVIKDLESTVIAFEKNVGLKTLRDYEKNAENELGYIQNLQDDAKEIYKKRGALCDSEGFYQHSGECWSDAFQQVILNTDGIKEQIQMFLINNHIPNLDSYPDNLFVPSEIEDPKSYISVNSELIQNQKRWARIYLQEVQKRFLRHYITEVKRRMIKEDLCKSPQPAEVAREKLSAISKESSQRKSGKEGQTSAILSKLGKYKTNVKNRYKNLRGHYTVSLESYRKNPERFAGGSTSDIILLLRIVEAVFFGRLNIIKTHGINFLNENGYKDFYLEMNETKNDFLGPLSACLLGVALFEPESISGKTPKRLSGHQVAFYTCGGTSQYYEDNTGSIPFTWKKFLKLLYVKRDESASVEFYHLIDRANTYYSNRYYPVVVCASTGKKFTFLGGNMIEFTTEYTSTNGAVELKPNSNYSQKLEEIVFIHANKISSIENKGFVPDPYSRIKKSPLIQALMESDLKYIKDFLSIQGAKEKEIFLKGDSDGKTILHAAVNFASENTILDYLLSLGADINAQRNGKITPLMIAVDMNNLKAVRFLCEKGADVTIKDINQRTALDRAKTEEMKNLLTSCGTPSASKGGRRKTKKVKKVKKSKTRRGHK